MKAKIIFHRALFVLYIAAVVWLCVHNFNSVKDFPRTIAGLESDKIVHFCMFLPFPFFTYISYDRKRKSVGGTLLFVAAILVLGTILAAGTEVTQSFLPYRTADITDLYADLSGLVAGSLFVLITDLNRINKHKSHKKN